MKRVYTNLAVLDVVPGRGFVVRDMAPGVTLDEVQARPARSCTLMVDMRIAEARDGGVLTLTLDYPARRNALALPLREELHRLLEDAQSDRAIRAIVLTGAGGTFCSGGDISGMNVADGARRAGAHAPHAPADPADGRGPLRSSRRWRAGASARACRSPAPATRSSRPRMRASWRASARSG